MDEEPEFFDDGARAETQRDRAKASAQRSKRIFCETFHTPSGKWCMAELKFHLAAEGVINRGPESPSQVARRDAMRDVYYWIEGLAREGAKERESIVG